MGAFAVAFGCLAGGYLFGRWQEGKSNAVVGWFIEIARPAVQLPRGGWNPGSDLVGQCPRLKRS